MRAARIIDIAALRVGTSRVSGGDSGRDHASNVVIHSCPVDMTSGLARRAVQPISEAHGHVNWHVRAAVPPSWSRARPSIVSAARRSVPPGVVPRRRESGRASNYFGRARSAARSTGRPTRRQLASSARAVKVALLGFRTVWRQPPSGWPPGARKWPRGRSLRGCQSLRVAVGTAEQG